MTRFRPLATVIALVVAAAVSAAPARGALLSDSTVVESWKLDNGLEVRTRHVPGAGGVAVTLAFRAGRGYEPAGREGLSELLAELEFTSAAGDVPERTREEMASLRPLGWESRPGTRLVRFTEIATREQLPGVLQQMATRLRGVAVTDAGLRAALGRVRRDAGERLFGAPSDALYWRASALARGLTDEQIVREASMPGLDKLTAKDAASQLARWYHAGNASLALAGDLAGLDVPALVRSLFAPLPGGAALPDTVRVRLVANHRVAPWSGLKSAVGVLAVAAPALTDSLHPGFYLGMLVTGPGVTASWGPAPAPLASRFQYSLFDEPELVRFYPPVPADALDPDLLSGALYEQLQVVGGQMADASILNAMRGNVRWLLGGELSRDLRAHFHRDPASLGTLSNGMATRALWMGDPFWDRYRARFDGSLIGHAYFYEWLADATHQVRLLLTPGH